VAYSEAAMKAREEENQLKPRPIRPQASVVDLREASQDHIVRNRSGVYHVSPRPFRTTSADNINTLHPSLPCCMTHF
jgi:hypothetical protein